MKTMHEQNNLNRKHKKEPNRNAGAGEGKNWKMQKSFNHKFNHAKKWMNVKMDFMKLAS